MKRMFVDARGRVRNGWWIVLFIALFAASRAVYPPVVAALRSAGLDGAWLEPVPFLLVLLVTWACLRLRRQSLADVGLGVDRRWLRQAGLGTLLGGGSALLAAGLLWSVGGVRMELDPARSLPALALGLYGFTFVALFEETLFRGFVFQRLVDGAGVWVAQLSLALLFAAGHWGNPDMHGVALGVAMGEIFLASLLLGLAWLRTRSLALPVGIHLGWNFLQGSVLGFGVSGFDQAGWMRPVLLDRPDWITGGAVGLEASVFAIVVDLGLLLVLWRWNAWWPRSARRSTPVPA